MKARIKAFIAIVFTVLCCVSGGMSAYAMTPVEPNVIVIEFNNAPEGMAFADILFKDKEKDRYRLGDGEASRCKLTFRGENETDFRELALGRDCGIAKYNDGYSSFFFNKTFPVEAHCSGGHAFIEITGGGQNKDLFNYYREFRVAYCDEKGNVLGVTDAINVEKTDDLSEYHIYADGTSLSYEIKKEPKVGLLLLILFVVVILLPSILLAIVIKWIAGFIKYKKSEERQRKQDERNRY